MEKTQDSTLAEFVCGDYDWRCDDAGRYPWSYCFVVLL